MATRRYGPDGTTSGGVKTFVARRQSADDIVATVQVLYGMIEGRISIARAGGICSYQDATRRLARDRYSCL